MRCVFLFYQGGGEMAGSSELIKAKSAKNDEFYTRLTDIEKELRYYRKHFRGKTIFCNCDDPFESNFFKYFVLNFNRLEIKKLICTCYAGSPIANTQLSLFDVVGDGVSKKENKPYKAVVTTVYDKTGDGGIDLFDIAELFKSGENELTQLKGDGDFRSEECIELLREADIVVTNPPFSLFRVYLSLLIKYKKKFIVMGNKNSINYKDVFPLFMKNKIWIGVRPINQDFWLYVPDGHKYEKIDEFGKKIKHIMACWYTNLDINKRHEELILIKRYSAENYRKYDNYNAINVDKVEDIPCDYTGIMGVPITFMDKYNPDQFQILGLSQKYGMGLESIKFYDDFKEIRQDKTFTGSSGRKTNGNPMLQGIPKKGNYYINQNGECVYSLYGRIFIRNKHPEETKK